MPTYAEYDQSTHQAALILGDPIAEAFEWMRNYALNLTEQCSDDEYGSSAPITVELLIETADSHQPQENGGSSWGDYITRGGTFEGESVDSTFWKKYAIFREIPLENVEQSSFFSCSC